MTDNNLREKLLVMLLAVKLGIIKIEDVKLDGFSEAEVRKEISKIKEELSESK